MVDAVLIYTTWPDNEAAEAAGRALVGERLAACVNILAPARSIYEWDDALQVGNEQPMLIKTVAARVDDVIALVERLHPNEVPAVMVFEASGGHAAFLKWISEQSTGRG